MGGGGKQREFRLHVASTRKHPRPHASSCARTAVAAAAATAGAPAAAATPLLLLLPLRSLAISRARALALTCTSSCPPPWSRAGPFFDEEDEALASMEFARPRKLPKSMSVGQLAGMGGSGGDGGGPSGAGGGSGRPPCERAGGVGGEQGGVAAHASALPVGCWQVSLPRASQPSKLLSLSYSWVWRCCTRRTSPTPGPPYPCLQCRPATPTSWGLWASPSAAPTPSGVRTWGAAHLLPACTSCLTAPQKARAHGG